MSLKSCLFECEIWHQRSQPKPHVFRHKHFMFYIALEESKLFHSQLRLFGVDESRLCVLRSQDHFPSDNHLSSNDRQPSREQHSADDAHTSGSSRLESLSLIDRVNLVARRGGVREKVEKIRILTNVRIFGYAFNPISIFYCLNADEKLLCCICEVGNTFGEKKPFVLKDTVDAVFTERQKKFFYVSPFTELNQDFDFKIGIPGEELFVTIDTLNGGDFVVKSGMRGRRVELTDRNIWRLLCRNPLASLRVIALIHLHAFFLWLKGVPFHQKYENLDLQKGILNPLRTTNGATQGNYYYDDY